MTGGWDDEPGEDEGPHEADGDRVPDDSPTDLLMAAFKSSRLLEPSDLERHRGSWPRGREPDDALFDDELWPSTFRRLHAALADRLERAGNPRASEAATSVLVRGRLGLSVEDLSKSARVPERWLRFLEQNL